MKVGIMTWYFGNNYGAKLHSYALQQVLKQKGYEVVMINYFAPRVPKVNIRMNLNSPNIFFHPVILLKCLYRCKRFADWTSRRYHASERVRTPEEINALGCDAIIIGSDEVFNYRHPFFSDVYYGKGLNVPLITYAPSSGQADPDKRFSEELRVALGKIRHFSARDDHTVQLIQNNVDREVKLVADPTLLYDYDDVDDTCFSSHAPYLLVYSFESWDIYQKQVKSFAEKSGLKVICVGRHSGWADESYTDASVEMWLSAFRHAAYVFTDSFHGVVFAVKNHVQFVIVSRPDKVNKINDFLNLVGIRRDFYDGSRDLSECFAEETDYDSVMQIISEKKQESLEYLTSSLEDCYGR